MANRDGVVADGDVAVSAAGGEQQGKNLERLPIGEHCPKLGVQPFQLGRVRLAKVVLQRRNVPTAIRPTSAALPTFADVGDATDHRANVGAVTVVQLANRTTSKAGSAGSAVLVQLLADELLLNRQQDCFASAKVKPTSPSTGLLVSRCRRKTSTRRGCLVGPEQLVFRMSALPVTSAERG